MSQLQLEFIKSEAEMPINLADLYTRSYFQNRNSTDTQRLISFSQELRFIQRFSDISENVLDIGCSTGEFLRETNWKGKRFGMEISEHAASLASANGIEVVDNFDALPRLDNIIYRGTIQHLDSPFVSLQNAYDALRDGGMLYILATPNTRSMLFKIFNDLPALDASRNFYLPSDTSLVNICKIFGFELVALEYPYRYSPYASFVLDHTKFFKNVVYKVFGRQTNINFPFWKNMMNIAFKKKVNVND